MPAVPSAKAKIAVRAFNKFGFAYNRKRGSHIILVKPEYDTILVIPSHGNDPLRKGTLRSLIRDAGITVQDFIDAM